MFEKFNKIHDDVLKFNNIENYNQFGENLSVITLNSLDKNIFKPLSVNYLKNEYGGPVYVYDIGKNIVGTCSILLRQTNKKSGDAETKTNGDDTFTIILRHGEMLLSNGSLNLNYPNLL